MNVEEYIASGMVESYVLGLSTPEEREELEKLLPQFPELKTELKHVEHAYHKLCLEDAYPPPIALRQRTLQPRDWADTNTGPEKKPNYTFINIAPNQSDFITVHKVWKWIFFAAFLLFKLCLFLAIFFYFKYRQVEDRQQERDKIRLEYQNQNIPR